MSCIVGVIDGENVILGADSAGSNGNEIYTFPNRKVFARDAAAF